MNADGQRLSIFSNQKIDIHPVCNLFGRDRQAELHQGAALNAGLQDGLIGGCRGHARRQLGKIASVVVGRQENRLRSIGTGLGNRRDFGSSCSGWRCLLPVSPADDGGQRGGSGKHPGGYPGGAARKARFATSTKLLLQAHFDTGGRGFKARGFVENTQILLQLPPRLEQSGAAGATGRVLSGGGSILRQGVRPIHVESQQSEFFTFHHRFLLPSAYRRTFPTWRRRSPGGARRAKARALPATMPGHDATASESCPPGNRRRAQLLHSSSLPVRREPPLPEIPSEDPVPPREPARCAHFFRQSSSESVGPLVLSRPYRWR